MTFYLKVYGGIIAGLLLFYPGLYVITVWVLVGLFLAREPPLGQGVLIHEVSRSHKTTHHSR